MEGEKGQATAGANPATNEGGNSGGTRRRILGRRRRTAGLTVETFWMWTLGLTAECGANVMLVMLCGMAPLEAMVHAVFPPSIDAQLTMLNLSGAFFDGAAVFLAKWHFEFSEPPLLLVFRSGFCSVWTSLAGVVEHGASLQPLTGIGYLGIMICLGVGANELGRLCMEFIAVPVLVQAKLMKSSTSYVKINLSETLWDDVLFNLLAVFVALCAGLCHWDYLPYDLSELLTGFLVVPCSFAVGSWIEGGHEWDNVQWGTWRCNTAAFLVLLSTVVVTGMQQPFNTAACSLSTRSGWACCCLMPFCLMQRVALARGAAGLSRTPTCYPLHPKPRTRTRTCERA